MYSNKLGLKIVLRIGKIFEIKNDTQKNESKILCGYLKSDSHVWSRIFFDDRTSREKIEDFREQSKEETMWTYY